MSVAFAACQGFPRYWETPEQSFKDLLDDKCGPEQWAVAADNLAVPSDVKQTPSHLRGVPSQVNVPAITAAGAVCPLRGEALRSKHGSEITALLIKRANQCTGSGSPTSGWPEFTAENGVCIAIDLAKWDPKDALPTLQSVTEKGFELNTSGYSNLTMEIVRGIDWRLRLGDETSLELYKKVLETALAAHDLPSSYFAPLWRHEGEGVAAFAQALFNDPGSPLNVSQLAKNPAGIFIITNEIRTSLLLVTAFRLPAMTLLSDQTVIGKIWMESNGWITWSTTGGGLGHFSSRSTGPPLIAGAQPLRICDLVAYGFTTIKDAPFFDGGSCAVTRDEEIRKIQQFLTKNADTLQPAEQDWMKNWP